MVAVDLRVVAHNDGRGARRQTDHDELRVVPGTAFAVAGLAGLINGKHLLAAVLLVGGVVLAAWGRWTKERAGKDGGG